MDLKLYEAARDGNATLLTAYDTTNLTALTPHQNTALHITAIYGRQGFAEEILNKCPSLLCRRNAEGDTALHLAARMGHVNIAMLLTTRYRQQRAGGHEEPQLSTESSMWSMRNMENNTALHDALRNGCTEVALHLLELDHHLAHLGNKAGGESPLLAHFVNGAGESPLYLAAQSGLLPVVEKIVSGGPSSFSQEGPNSQTPLHAATIKKHPAMRVYQILWKYYWRRPRSS